jgi:hypothetical protein
VVKGATQFYKVGGLEKGEADGVSGHLSKGPLRWGEKWAAMKFVNQQLGGGATKGLKAD